MEHPSLEELETKVRGETRQRHGPVLECLEALLNCYLEGFRELDHFTSTEGNEREQVWVFLVTKSFNSMRWAFHLLQHGYYTQALTLIRTVWEDWLVCEDCVNRPDTVIATLGKGGRVPSFKKMADRMEEPLRSDWIGESQGDEGTYGVLSTFAHPRARAIHVIRNPESGVIRLGPNYDERLFLYTSHVLINAGIRMTEVVSFV